MPIGRRPLALIVEPVETRSTIASASPSRGVASTEPETGTSSQSTPRSASSRRVETGYAVATRSPSRSAISVCGASTGTAASSEQRAKPSSASVTTSASASTTRFAPVIPTSTTPSCAYSGMSLGRTSSRSTGAFAHGTTSERSVTSNESPASAQSRSAGSAIRPLAGTARVSRPFAPARESAALIAAASPSGGRARAGSRRRRAGATARRASPSRSRSAPARRSRGTACPARAGRTVCHRCVERLELGQRAEVAEEAPHLVARPQERGSRPPARRARGSARRAVARAFLWFGCRPSSVIPLIHVSMLTC